MKKSKIDSSNDIINAKYQEKSVQSIDSSSYVDVPSIDLEKVVNEGIKDKKSLFQSLKTIINDIGLKNIFHDKNELIFITSLVIAINIYCMLMVNKKSIYSDNLYRFIFVISPILFFIIVIFSFFNSKERGAFELEMTCKYNLYQMLSLRMFIFSIITILVNSIVIVEVFICEKNFNVLRAVSISIAGLFLFSCAFLFISLYLNGELLKFLSIILWIILNIALYCSNKHIYNSFLTEAPLYIHIGIAVICIVIYINSLKKLINFRNEKGEF